MELVQIKEKIFSSLEQIGLIFENNQNIDNINLAEYLEESIVFIQFIVTLEEEFKIEFPDEFLAISRLETIESLALTIQELLN